MTRVSGEDVSPPDMFSFCPPTSDSELQMLHRETVVDEAA